MRFLKQTNKFNCGPTAIINCLKDHGFNFTAKDLPEISHQVDCNPVFGTNEFMILAYLSEFFSYKVILEPTELPTKFIMLYETSQLAHIVYVTQTGTQYLVTNYLDESSRKFTHKLFTEKEILELLQFQDQIIPNIVEIFR